MKRIAMEIARLKRGNINYGASVYHLLFPRPRFIAPVVSFTCSAITQRNSIVLTETRRGVVNANEARKTRNLILET